MTTKRLSRMDRLRMPPKTGVVVSRVVLCVFCAACFFIIVVGTIHGHFWHLLMPVENFLIRLTGYEARYAQMVPLIFTGLGLGSAVSGLMNNRYGVLSASRIVLEIILVLAIVFFLLATLAYWALTNFPAQT